MQIHKLEMSRCPSSRLLIAALAAATCGAVWADEPSPWYVGASQALTHDSNVFRVPNGPSDTYSDTSLFGGFDQPVSRQRFYAAANLHYSKYSSQSALDNTSYGVNAGWDWATIESLSGNLGASANQSLAARDNNTTQALTARASTKRS